MLVVAPALAADQTVIFVEAEYVQAERNVAADEAEMVAAGCGTTSFLAVAVAEAEADVEEIAIAIAIAVDVEAIVIEIEIVAVD